MPQIQRAADVGRQAWAPSAAGVSGLEKVTLHIWMQSQAVLQYGNVACITTQTCYAKLHLECKTYGRVLSCVTDQMYVLYKKQCSTCLP